MAIKKPLVLDSVTRTVQRLQLGDVLEGSMATVPSDYLNLYIASDGDDETGDGTEPNPWLSVRKCMEVLAPFMVPPGSQVVIHCKKGIYDVTQSPSFDHISGDRIRVEGQATGANFTSIHSISGSPGAWEYTLQFDRLNPDQYEIGYFLKYYWVDGPDYTKYHMVGLHEIIGIDYVNDRVTVLNKSKATGTANLATSGNGTCIQTVFKTTHGAWFVSKDCGIVFRQFVIDTQGLSYALQQDVLSRVTLDGDWGIANAELGVYMLSGSYFSGSQPAISGCTGSAFWSIGGHINTPQAVFNGNNNGYYLDTGTARISESRFIGMDGWGVRASGCDVEGGGNVLLEISYRAVEAVLGSRVKMPESKVHDNALGFYAASYAVIDQEVSTYSGNFIDCDPACPVPPGYGVGNKNGMIVEGPA